MAAPERAGHARGQRAEYVRGLRAADEFGDFSRMFEKLADEQLRGLGAAKEQREGRANRPTATFEQFASFEHHPTDE